MMLPWLECGGAAKATRAKAESRRVKMDFMTEAILRLLGLMLTRFVDGWEVLLGEGAEQVSRRVVGVAKLPVL